MVYNNRGRGMWQQIRWSLMWRCSRVSLHSDCFLQGFHTLRPFLQRCYMLHHLLKGVCMHTAMITDGPSYRITLG